MILIKMLFGKKEKEESNEWRTIENVPTSVLLNLVCHNGIHMYGWTNGERTEDNHLIFYDASTATRTVYEPSFWKYPEDVPTSLREQFDVYDYYERTRPVPKVKPIWEKNSKNHYVCTNLEEYSEYSILNPVGIREWVITRDGKTIDRLFATLQEAVDFLED